MYLQLVGSGEHLRPGSSESDQNRETKAGDVKPPTNRLVLEWMGAQDRQVGGPNQAPAERHQTHCVQADGNRGTSLKNRKIIIFKNNF